MPNNIYVPPACYERLREVARARQTIFYSDLAPYCEIDPKFVFPIFPILDEVNCREHVAGRRLLSAVVIAKRSGMPGPGFFKKAKEFGVCSGTVDRACWKAELLRVHDFWSRH